MRNVVPKEGPRAPLFCGAVALLLWANLANAQTVDVSTLEVCSALETEALKLACFEALISKRRTAATEVPPPEVVNSTPAVVTEVTNASEVPAIIEAASQTAESMTALPVSTVPSASDSTVADKPLAAIGATPHDVKTSMTTDVAPIATEPSVASDRELEQLGESQEEYKKVIKATVVDVTQGFNKDLRFHLANGQVWRQIEPRHLQYPKNRDFEIKISQGMMGAYRMRIGENGRMVKIRRTQ